MLNVLVETALHNRRCNGLGPILFDRSLADHLPTTGDELDQFLPFFRGFSHRSRPDIPSESCADARVDAVRFGQDGRIQI